MVSRAMKARSRQRMPPKVVSFEVFPGSGGHWKSNKNSKTTHGMALMMCMAYTALRTGSYTPPTRRRKTRIEAFTNGKIGLANRVNTMAICAHGQRGSFSHVAPRQRYPVIFVVTGLEMIRVDIPDMHPEMP